MSKKKHTVQKVAVTANESLKSGLFAAIFTFQSNLGGIKAILEQNLKFILFPLAAVTEVITTILALTGLINAENKNLRKTFDFVLSLVTTTLVLTAVIGGLYFGFPLFAISGLFLAAIGAGALYNMGQFFYNAYRWLNLSSEAKNEKVLYRAQMLKYGIASFIGLTIVMGIVTTMILSMAAPIVLATGGIVTAVVLVVGGIYRLHKHFHPTPENNLVSNITNIKNDIITHLEDEKDYRKSLKNDIAATRESSSGNTVHRIFGFYPQEAKRKEKLANSKQRSALLKHYLPDPANTIVATCQSAVNQQSFFKDRGKNELLNLRHTELLNHVHENTLGNTENTQHNEPHNEPRSTPSIWKQCWDAGAIMPTEAEHVDSFSFS
ncbi:MAG: hypothetical protein REH83_01275 [Rickettsiella sp.]|nr:hypothetical protein [Rickettsiella sp.]